MIGLDDSLNDIEKTSESHYRKFKTVLLIDIALHLVALVAVLSSLDQSGWWIVAAIFYFLAFLWSIVALCLL